jgi:hypothetical protein
MEGGYSGKSVKTLNGKIDSTTDEHGCGAKIARQTQKKLR